jgi:hypothetical protein
MAFQGRRVDMALRAQLDAWNVIAIERMGRPIGAVSEANTREIFRTLRVRKGDCPSAGQAAPSER